MANKFSKLVKGAVPFLAIMGLAAMSGEVAANEAVTPLKAEMTIEKKANTKTEPTKEIKAFASNSNSKSTTCNGCSGTCSGSCSGLCEGCRSCSGTCSGLCLGCNGCQGTCSGTCSGSCHGYK